MQLHPEHIEDMTPGRSWSKFSELVQVKSDLSFEGSWSFQFVKVDGPMDFVSYILTHCMMNEKG